MNDKKASKSENLFDNFENLVQQVFSNADEKANFLKKFEKFKATCKKRSIELSENDVSRGKKLKLKIRTQVPNEIWLKIMKYLPSKDCFGSFALVNKHFHGLTLDPSALKYLQIGDIKNDLHFEKLMKVVKRSKNLKEFAICAGKKSVEYWNRLVLKALKISIYLESLKVSVSISDDQVPYRYRDENNPDYSLSFEVLDAIKKRKSLKVLHLQDLRIKPQIGIEISQMKHLKSLQLSYGPVTIITPEIVIGIANNFNQLENIELWDWQFSLPHLGNQFRVALNNLFENNCKTLKRIKICVWPLHCQKILFKDQQKCVSLQNLALCQNLEEFSGAVHGHDLNVISKSQTLKKLEIEYTDEENLRDLLSKKMNLPNLKILSIKTERFDTSELFLNISKQYLPSLERLYIRSEKKYFYNYPLKLATLKKMMKNFPKLKSLQIDGSCVTAIDVPNEYLSAIFKKFGTFIIFGKVKEINMPDRQTNFEDFLENDPLTLGKYLKDKRSFAKWCENNIGYGY